MKTKFALFLLFNLFSVSIFAQNHNKAKQSAMKDWFAKEVFKVDISHLNNSHNENQNNQVNNRNATAQGEVLVSDISATESELHALINPTDQNNIVVSPISTANNTLTCPIYYTNDFGDNWQQSTFVNMPHEAGKTTFGGGDPVFAADTNGRIYLSWIDLYGTLNDIYQGNELSMGMFWAYSDDNGQSWTKPANDTISFGKLIYSLTGNVTITQPISDKEWMAVDRTGGAYNNNLYVAHVLMSQVNGVDTYQIVCNTKPVNSMSFNANETEVTAITGANAFSIVQFSSIDVDGNGNVHITFYGSKDNINFGVYHSVSTDGGQTFSNPNLVSNIKFDLPAFSTGGQTDNIEGINPTRLYPAIYSACSHTNSNVYVTWTAFGVNNDDGQKSQIYFSRSTDNGATWSTPITVNDDNANVDNYYSSITVAQNNDIKISWYDRRDDTTNNINTHYYMAISTDEGVSFGTNIQVSTLPTDFSHVGDNNQNFGVGEYNQVLTTDSYTIPVWTDGRTNDGNLNLYAAFISNTSGIKDIKNINGNLSIRNIYPNPTKDYAKVEYFIKNSTVISAKIIDNKGAVVKNIINDKKVSEGTNVLNINVNDLKKGIYYFVLDSPDFGKVVKPLSVF